MIINGGLNLPSFRLVPPSPRYAPSKARLRRVLRVDATHIGTRIDWTLPRTMPGHPAIQMSKDAHSSHLTSTRERRTLSWRQHQSGKLQSIEFKGLVRRPPHLVAKSRRTDVRRTDYVKQSLIVQRRRCRCYWYWYQTRKALYVSETATSPGLLTELRRGKAGKDRNREEIRHVERSCGTGSIMTGMLRATVWPSMRSGILR